MSKLTKLIFSPGYFFRDLLIKKYPVINSENCIEEKEEINFVNCLEGLEKKEIDFEKKFPIDVVFTWVDGSDENWLSDYTYFKSKYSPSHISSNSARFSSGEELIYSILSIKKNLPWIRKIFVITADQTPKFYKNVLPSEDLSIVNHKDIIPEDFLPTFNSHVIEAFLHKIPNLSENFIYFNDDVFVAKPLNQEHFFHKNGIANIFVSDKKISSLIDNGKITPTLYATLNSRSILKKKFNENINKTLIHTYVPLKKSCFEKVWSDFGKDISCFLKNKFREKNDLNLATFLVPWYMYLTGKSVPAIDICYYFNIRSNHALMQYKKLIAYKKNGFMPHSICANDVSDQNKPQFDHQTELNNFLKKYFI